MGLSLRSLRPSHRPTDAAAPQTPSAPDPGSASVAKKIGAALAAAALVPSVVLATHARPTTPPSRGPAVVRVDDEAAARALDLQVENAEGNGAASTVTRALAGTQVELRIWRDELARLSPEQKGAHRLLRGLFEAVEPADDSLAALRALTGQEVGAVVIDKAAVARTAAKLRSVGLPLTRDGIATFQRQRAAAGLDDGALALRYAAALHGGAVVADLPAHATAAQRGAVSVYEALGAHAAAELARELHAQAPRGALATQATKLHDQVITRSAIDRLVTEATSRGLSLSPAGIAAFRGARGLGHKSEVTARTAREIATPVTTVGARPAHEQARADWYRRIVESQGHTWRSGVNQVNVVGLRGYDVTGHENSNAFNRWNDTIAFVWKNTRGKYEVREFRATTDPGMKSYYDSPDVNHDGSGDVADLRPGQYPYSLGTHHGYYGAGNPGYDLPVWRDTNHDGSIQSREKAASERRDDRGSGINIHWGPGAGASDVGLYSLGCQVLQLDRGAFLSAVTPVFELNRGAMKYTLVDMRTLA